MGATLEDLLVAVTTVQVQSAIQHDHVRAELAAIKEQTTKTNGRVDKLEDWRIEMMATAQARERSSTLRLLWLVPPAVLSLGGGLVLKMLGKV